jgi:hypothetical protein
VRPGDKVTIEADDHLGFPKQRAVVIEHYEAELWTVRVVEEDRAPDVNDAQGIVIVPDFDLKEGWSA